MYNIFLDELDKAIIVIDTIPEQTIVSKNGTYSLQVPKGTYRLMAAYENGDDAYFTEERVTIEQEGNYVIDLILAPDLVEEEIVDLNLTEDEFSPFESRASNLGLVITLALVLFFLLYLIFTRTHFLDEEHGEKHEHIPKSQPEVKATPSAPIADVVQTAGVEGDEVEQKLLAYLQQQGGRATQKDIRKMLGLSEAKVSLLLADLESQQVVRKIKRGRSNIVVLTAASSHGSS